MELSSNNESEPVQAKLMVPVPPEIVANIGKFC